MNRDNPIEKHLLTRCYSSEAKIDELLSSRYSITGDQKPSLLLIPTGTSNDTKTKSILHKEVDNKNENISSNRIKNTRNDLKVYIKDTLSKQKKLVKKIQAYNRKKSDKTKPFPVNKLLKHYNIPIYEDFVNLNQLWQSYMQNLLFPTATIPGAQTLLPKLSTADFTGCLMTVTHSRNKNLVGVRGIVLWDAQHSFILCVPRNEDAKELTESRTTFTPSEIVGGLRIIPKKSNLFAFDVFTPENDDEALGFTIVGSRFELRSVDRSGKKFKSHRVEDIL